MREHSNARTERAGKDVEGRKGQMIYHIGQEIETTYSNPPVSGDQQYNAGDIVDISDSDRGEMLAQFEVASSDDRTITGRIVHIGENS